MRTPGEDVRAGEVVLPAGSRLGPPQIALVAALGQAQVAVTRRPRVALFTSGDEQTPVGQPLTAGAIYDSNRYLLRAMLEEMGVSVGDADCVREVFSKFGDIHFWRIDMKLGQPLAFGRPGGLA